MISQKYFGSKHYFSFQSDCGMTMPLAIQNFKKSIENSRKAAIGECGHAPHN